MCHVQQCACCISLYPHVLGLRKTSQRAQSSRAGYLGLVVFMRSQVGDAADSVALYLHVRRHHLSYQRRKTSKSHDQDLILRYLVSIPAFIEYRIQKKNVLFTAKLPRAALAARCTSISGLCSKKRIGSRVSLSTSRTSVADKQWSIRFRTREAGYFAG